MQLNNMIIFNFKFTHVFKFGPKFLAYLNLLGVLLRLIV